MSLSTLVINTDLQSILSMFRLAVIGIAIVGVLGSLVLGLFMIVSWEVTGILVTAFVGIPSLVLAYLSSREEDSNGN